MEYSCVPTYSIMGILQGVCVWNVYKYPVNLGSPLVIHMCVVCNNIINFQHTFSPYHPKPLGCLMYTSLYIVFKIFIQYCPQSNIHSILAQSITFWWNLNKVLVYFMLLMLGFIQQKEKKTEAKNVQ